MKKIISLILALCLILTLSGCFSQSKFSQNPEKYDAFAQKDDVMPATDEVEDSFAVYPFYHHDGFIFEWNSYTLIAQYDAETYEKKIGEINDSYVFEEEVLQDHTKEHKLNPEFSVGDYRFRLLDVETYSCFFPESYFIGMNDTEHKIAYIYFDDYDLDVVESFPSLLTKYCGWNYTLNHSNE